MQTIPLEVITNSITVPMEVTTGGTVNMDVEPIRNVYIERPAYEGECTITPAAEAQTLSTSGKRMTGDIVIEAIPQNYGLITWNGSYLTVS